MEAREHMLNQNQTEPKLRDSPTSNPRQFPDLLCGPSLHGDVHFNVLFKGTSQLVCTVAQNLRRLHPTAGEPFLLTPQDLLTGASTSPRPEFSLPLQGKESLPSLS